MSKNQEPILFPPARMVQGNLYEPRTTDALGNPLVVKNGPNRGQPRQDFYFAFAIPKTPGVTHWAHEKHPDPRVGDWGAKLWNTAHKFWPGGQTQRTDFAWKIDDGDSTIPNKNNKRPCDQVGFPGHWIVRCGGGYAPKIVNKDGSAYILEPGAVKCGYYIQVYGNISSNESDQTAGLYINHSLVSLQGFADIIASGPDPSSVGFGTSALPAGASSVPLAGMTVPATGAPPPPPSAPSGHTALPPVHAAPATPTPPPNNGFVANAAGAPPPPGGYGATPPPPAAPAPAAYAAAPPPPAAAPAAPPPPVGRAMTAAATTSYDAYRAAGWDDAALIAHGLMFP